MSGLPRVGPSLRDRGKKVGSWWISVDSTGRWAIGLKNGLAPQRGKISSIGSKTQSEIERDRLLLFPVIKKRGKNRVIPRPSCKLSCRCVSCGKDWLHNSSRSSYWSNGWPSSSVRLSQNYWKSNNCRPCSVPVRRGRQQLVVGCSSFSWW
jgi:hypothetical protein